MKNETFKERLFRAVEEEFKKLGVHHVTCSETYKCDDTKIQIFTTTNLSFHVFYNETCSGIDIVQVEYEMKAK